MMRDLRTLTDAAGRSRSPWTALLAAIFLLVFASLMYFTKKKVWHEVEKPTEMTRGQDPKKTTV